MLLPATVSLLVLLSTLQLGETCKLRWHSRDATQVKAEEDAIKEHIREQQEQLELESIQEEEVEEEEEEEDENDTTKQVITCRDCTAEEEEEEEEEEEGRRKKKKKNPRLFWPIVEVPPLKSLPCCSAYKRLANTTQCGRKPYNNRILNGVKAEEHEFPWHCALLREDGSYLGCGAVLFSCDPVIIVTAAHCFIQDPEPGSLMVSCGAVNVDRPDPSPMDQEEIRLNVSAVIRHQDFRWLTAHSPILGDNTGHPSGLGLFENDIAIVKVEEPELLECKKKVIWPACFPTEGIDYAGWSRTGVAGWGQTERQGNISKVLMKVNSPIVTDDYCELKVCQTHFGPIGIQNCVITPSKVCAGGIPDKGPCRGDSGGALLAQDLEVTGWSAVGLVSYQPGNILDWPRCGSDKFTVFTEISKYLGWIAAQFDMLPPLSPMVEEVEEDAEEEDRIEPGIATRRKKKKNKKGGRRG